MDIKRSQFKKKLLIAAKHLRDNNYHDSLYILQELETEIKSIVENNVGDWDLEQTVGLKALALQESGDLAKAIDTYNELGESSYEKARYYCESAGCKLAFAALICFETDREEEACQLAEKAIQLSSLVVSVSEPIRQVSKKLEAVKNRQAREKHER